MRGRVLDGPTGGRRHRAVRRRDRREHLADTGDRQLGAAVVGQGRGAQPAQQVLGRRRQRAHPRVGGPAPPGVPHRRVSAPRLRRPPVGNTGRDRSDRWLGVH